VALVVLAGRHGYLDTSSDGWPGTARDRRYVGRRSLCGSGSQTLAMSNTTSTTSIVVPAARASRVAASAPGMALANCDVATAAQTPIIRPPTFIAKLSP